MAIKPEESETEQSETVLRFWFSQQPDDDQAAMIRQWERWFRGGMDSYIVEHFAPLLARVMRGELDAWACKPRARLALIIVLDQFSRTLYRGTAQAFAQDEKARALTLEGIDVGHYAPLDTLWEKTFFFLPLGHSEDLKHLERTIELAEALVQEAPRYYRALLEFSAAQACRHRDVIAQFGRQPHRKSGFRATINA